MLKRLASLALLALLGTATPALADTDPLAQCEAQGGKATVQKSIPKIDAALQIAALNSCTIKVPVIVSWKTAPSRALLARYGLSLDPGNFSTGELDGAQMRTLAKRKDVRSISYRAPMHLL
jgi:hypothetical protein